MENNAAEQLAAISDIRASVADRLVTPVWYHPALGSALAAYVVAISLGSSAVRAIAGGLFVAAAALLGRVYRQRTGIWVSGHGAGPARWWAVAMGALIGAVVLTAWATGAYTEARWQVPVLAVIGFAGTIVLGRAFDNAVRAQLRVAS
ncbi:hypothetical protein [Actinoplanes couchii]|uniref:Transmembrane protein n=1 Tax=Actinoplanes couchii TaxID=403638 RepID=A0ABQ3X774_9ACTN|nr:hypothetical protein [Actinoplanes couchii]MDR6322187.1 hypothetical protein [Actinoplanes couchii]GID54352.1 hypothetical protein Aco03nite_027560 [Actinoplanes couchii]